MPALHPPYLAEKIQLKGFPVPLLFLLLSGHCMNAGSYLHPSWASIPPAIKHAFVHDVGYKKAGRLKLLVMSIKKKIQHS